MTCQTLIVGCVLAWLGSASQAKPPAAPAPAATPAATAPAPTPEREADRADVAPTQIIGNRELPKVLYIVPWKKPQAEALNGRPPVSVLDEILAPVDRDVFARQVRYRAQPEAASDHAANATHTAPAPAVR
jgi:hypothetical protein